MKFINRLLTALILTCIISVPAMAGPEDAPRADPNSPLPSASRCHPTRELPGQHVFAGRKPARRHRAVGLGDHLAESDATSEVFDKE